MRMIILTSAQAEQIRGRYGSYSAIIPVLLPDGNYMIPEDCKINLDLVDALSIIETMDGNTTEITELPEVGQPVYSGQIYNYLYVDIMTTVIAVQDHNRTIYPPQDTPALFTFFRENSDTLEWIPNEKVYVGWKRVYEDVTYVVLMDHMTQSEWTPPLTLGVLWATDSVVSGEWAPGVSYLVDQEVTYNGNTYKCLQDHTSQVGWDPVSVPALWQLVS